jgi:hypothetical protein
LLAPDPSKTEAAYAHKPLSAIDALIRLIFRRRELTGKVVALVERVAPSALRGRMSEG